MIGIVGSVVVVALRFVREKRASGMIKRTRIVDIVILVPSDLVHDGL